MTGRSPDWLLEAIETDLSEVEPQVHTLATVGINEEQLSSSHPLRSYARQLLPVTPILIDLEHYKVSAIWWSALSVLEILTQQLGEN
jgi:hypothetical protein